MKEFIIKVDHEDLNPIMDQINSNINKILLEQQLILDRQQLILDKIEGGVIPNPDPVDPDPKPPVTGDYITLEQFGGSVNLEDNWIPFKKAIELQQSTGKTIMLGENANYKILGFSSFKHDPTIHGKNSSLTIGIPKYNKWAGDNLESDHLFELSLNPIVEIIGVDILAPEHIDQVQLHFRYLFKGNIKSGAGSIIWIGNGADQIYQSWAMGFLYAGSGIKYDSNNNALDFLFTAQCKINHKGIGFQDMKANSGNGIFSVIRDVTVVSDEDYNNVSWKAKGKFVGNRFYPENFNVDRLKANNWENPTNWWWSVQFAHTYLICDGDIDNSDNSVGFRPVNKTANWINRYLYREDQHTVENSTTRSNVISVGVDSEYHSGNKIKISGIEYTIVDKRRLEGGSFEPLRHWLYTLDKTITEKSGVLELSENQFPHQDLTEVYLCFRGNYVDVSRLSTDPNTLTWMAIPNCPNKPYYNHIQMGTDWKNLTSKGYYRQSSNGIPESKSIGYKLVNCTGLESINGTPTQFGPLPLVSNYTNSKILEFVNKVESLL